MAVETATYIHQLNSAAPSGTDGVSEGDNHIKLIKATVQATFPGVAGAVTATHTQIGETAAFLQAGTGTVERSGRAKMRDVVSVKDYGAVGDGATDDTAAIQAAIDANQTGAVFFPHGEYLCSSEIVLTDDNGHDFQGSLVGDNATVVFSNAGLSTDTDATMQHGFEAYPTVNGSGGDITGMRYVSVSSLNIVGPTNGASFYIANSQGVRFERVQTSTNRYGIVNECCINVNYTSCIFEDYKNAGVGLIMSSDTSRVWYGSGSPATSYWNDSPHFLSCIFKTSSFSQPLAHVLDHGSQSESTRLMESTLFYSNYSGSGPLIGTQYGIIARNANWTVERTWFENVTYPIRILEAAASEGTGNLAGVAGAQPSGTYSLTNFPDGFSYNLAVRGCDFVRGFQDINCSGVRGTPRFSGNRSLFLQDGGLHIASPYGAATQVVLDDPAALISPGAGYAYSSLALATYVNTANVLANWTPVVTSSTGSITSYTINRAKFQRRGKWVEGSADITITNNGTGAGAVLVTPPATPATNGGVIVGRETVLTGSIVGGEINGGQMLLVQYNNTYPGGTNARLVFSFAYEAT